MKKELMTLVNMIKNKMSNKLLRENLEKGDLSRLVHDQLHIDEYKSKMGDDADICVLSFKVSGKEPSQDLVAFLEKGYDFVLDADVSSGEKEGGDYLVFVELERTSQLPEQIMVLMEDLMNLTAQELSAWRFKYYRSSTEHELSQDNLRSVISLSSDNYKKKFEKDDIDIDSLKTAAGINVDSKAPTNEYTESLRIAAGIK